MKNNMGVVVNLNEYHQQQRNEKQKEREKRKEAQQNLHRFSGVGDASFGMEDEDNRSSINHENPQVEGEEDILKVDQISEGKEVKKCGLKDLPSTFTSTLVASSTIAIVNELFLQKSLTSMPLVYHQNTKQNDILQSFMSPVLMRRYQPRLFIGTRSVLNSTYGYMKPGQSRLRSGPSNGFRERIKCSRDGAILALDWKVPGKVMGKFDDDIEKCSNYVKHGTIQETVVLILHGVNTDTSFGYMQSIMNSCVDMGWVAVGMNSRGVGKVDLNTPRFGNAAYTNDLRNVIEVLCSRLTSNAKLFIIGFSLGANTVVKYLGESGLTGDHQFPTNIAGAVSLCNPLLIDHSRLRAPWSQILTFGAKKHMLQQRHVVKQMKCDNFKQAMHHATFYSKSLAELSGYTLPYMIRNSTRYPFENSLGYVSNEEYWDEASSKNYIAHVSVPLMVCFAGDDSITSKVSSFMSTCLSNPNVIMVQTPCGGHIGWHDKSIHGNFVDRTVAQFINAVLRKEHWSMVEEGRKKAAQRLKKGLNMQSKL